MRAGLITHTHSSGAPLPLPIRVSSGFLVMGLSGNTRTQILPPRLMKRVIATRRLDLPRRHPARLHRLQAVVSERHVGASPRFAGHATALLLAVLDLFRHQ